LHALLAVLQALWPLQELIPMHSTDVTFLAAAGVADRPPMASAIAATARVAPDTIFVFMLIISSWIRSQNEHVVSPEQNSQTFIRSSGQQCYKNFLKEDRSDAEAGDDRQKLVGRQCFGEVKEHRKGIS
jgi:hypothetical protein